jgi:uncharacterized repeat protein (TIGR02543 family)
MWGEPALTLNFVDSAGNATTNVSGYYGVSSDPLSATPTTSAQVASNASTLALTPTSGDLTGYNEYVFYSPDNVNWQKTSAVITNSDTGNVKIYKITYNGTANDINVTDSPSPQYVPEGTTSTLTTNVPSGDDSVVCVGWDTTQNGTGGTLYVAGPLSGPLFPAAGDTMYNVATGIQSDVTLYAQYEAPNLTVNFYDHTGVLMVSDSVPYGGSVTPPMPSTRTGYTFTGWTSNDFTSVKSNLDLQETYAANTYTIAFTDYDGSTIATRAVPYGGTATPPAAPLRSGYTFTGWNGSYSNVTANGTCAAQYKADAATATLAPSVPSAPSAPATAMAADGNNDVATAGACLTDSTDTAAVPADATAAVASAAAQAASGAGSLAAATPLAQSTLVTNWPVISLLSALALMICGAVILLALLARSKRKKRADTDHIQKP